VKGFSKLCPHIPEEIRGTYAGLGSSWAIDEILSNVVYRREAHPC
jgi:pullulanase/glycogen debranching enzyme